jgi:hypothetical protein
MYLPVMNRAALATFLLESLSIPRITSVKRFTGRCGQARLGSLETVRRLFYEKNLHVSGDTFSGAWLLERLVWLVPTKRKRIEPMRKAPNPQEYFFS